MKDRDILIDGYYGIKIIINEEFIINNKGYDALIIYKKMITEYFENQLILDRAFRDELLESYIKDVKLILINNKDIFNNSKENEIQPSSSFIKIIDLFVRISDYKINISKTRLSSKDLSKLSKIYIGRALIETETNADSIDFSKFFEDNLNGYINEFVLSIINNFINDVFNSIFNYIISNDIKIKKEDFLKKVEYSKKLFNLV